MTRRLGGLSLIFLLGLVVSPGLLAGQQGGPATRPAAAEGGGKCPWFEQFRAIRAAAPGDDACASWPAMADVSQGDSGAAGDTSVKSEPAEASVEELAKKTQNPMSDLITVPLGGGVGRLFRIGKLPVNASLASFYNVEHPTFGPQWSVRFQIQFQVSCQSQTGFQDATTKFRRQSGWWCIL